MIQCFSYSSSYALHIATLLPEDTNVDKYFELIEDIVAQADEVDETYLQVCIENTICTITYEEI